jgi:starch phosphorylase
VSRRLGVELDLDSIFDVQVKRIHEYKRQVLNVMHILHRYLRIKDGDTDGYLPRTFLLGGKAAPGYAMAKLIIRLINDVASLVNHDPAASELLRVVFLPDYGVSLAQRIMPAADLSEQISTAGTEASGTGNMKLAMNGAPTIGTLDGANIEIREEVGDDAFFLFGHTVEELDAMRRSGSYDPWEYHERDVELRRVVDLFTGAALSSTGTSYRPLHDALMTHGDRFFHLADFRSYVETQEAVDAAYRDRDRWIRMAIANIAGSGRFSSDRTIRAYASEIWHLDPARDEAALG